MGRILGFSVVALLVVAIMGIVGFVWVKRQIPESAKPGLICRVPVYGKLSFKDREGLDVEKGVNTGDIWEFRSYIEGGTKAAAIWTFPIDSEGDHLKLESRFEAFRTHKGRIGQSLQVRYVLVNDTKQLRVPLESFEIAEFALNEREVARQISYYDETAKAKKSVDLFKDLVDQGKLTIEVQCMDSGQYWGWRVRTCSYACRTVHSRSDISRQSLGIGLLTVFVVAIGVMASTFVKGPVATLLTFHRADRRAGLSRVHAQVDHGRTKRRRARRVVVSADHAHERHDGTGQQHRNQADAWHRQHPGRWFVATATPHPRPESLRDGSLRGQRI